VHTSAYLAYESATKTLDAPLAIVDLDAFDANADDLIRRASDRAIRVVTKSLRCRFLIERALAKTGFSGLMCYSLPEALWLAKSRPLLASPRETDQTGDIVVAYPTADREALIGLAAEERTRSKIAVTIDSLSHLDFIDAILGQDHPTIRICLELDASWRPNRLVHVGARRSPVHSPVQLAKLAKEVLARPGFTLVGVLSYESQIAGLPDSLGNPLRRAVIGWMRVRSSEELRQRRTAAIAAVRELTELEFINGGGTGSMESTRLDDSVTEIAAGSGLVGPALFDHYTQFRPRPAALFALPVVRRPAPRIATLYAGGYVASGPADGSRLPTPVFPAGLDLLPWEGAGEVQTPIRGKAASQLRVGDRVWLRHAKAGELAEHFDRYHLVAGERTVANFPTYRGEGKNFG
jgi:D-serine deaminase-like pyridoxal phosphate-dependent protein